MRRRTTVRFYDGTLTELNASPRIFKSNEFIIVDGDNTKFKKGDDESTFSELPWVNATATAMNKAATVAALAASTNITAVPASFADLAAVQTYLAGANVVPNIETRLDNLEAKVNAILTSIKAAGLMA